VLLLLWLGCRWVYHCPVPRDETGAGLQEADQHGNGSRGRLLLFRRPIGYLIYLKSGDELVGGHDAIVCMLGLAEGQQQQQKRFLDETNHSLHLLRRYHDTLDHGAVRSSLSETTLALRIHPATSGPGSDVAIHLVTVLYLCPGV
jgi:hypothetical protein